MSAWAQLEPKATALVCPDCGTCSLALHLRCDISDSECMAVATCRHCGRQFDAESIDTYQDRYAISRAAADEPCSSCGAPQRVLRWVCTRSAKTCHMLLTCESCGESRAA